MIEVPVWFYVMSWLAIGLFVWLFLIGLPIGILIGRVVARRDRQIPTDSPEHPDNKTPDV